MYDHAVDHQTGSRRSHQHDNDNYNCRHHADRHIPIVGKEITHAHEDPRHQRQFHIGEHIAEHGENKRKHYNNDQHQQNDQHQRIRQSTLDL